MRAGERYRGRVAHGLSDRLGVWEKRLTRLMLLPFPLIVPAVWVQYAADGFASAGEAVAGLVLVPAGVLALGFAWVYSRMVRHWEALSVEHLRQGDETLPVDWNSRGWRATAEVLRDAGVDPKTIAALGVFVPYLNLRIVLMGGSPFGASLRRYRGVSYWFEQRWRWSIGIGLALGVLMAIFPDQLGWLPRAVDSWYDGPLFAPVMVPLMAILLPVAGWVGSRHFRLNLRDPQLFVVVSTQWRTLLREDSGTQGVLFLHEIAHVRHRDGGTAGWLLGRNALVHHHTCPDRKYSDSISPSLDELSTQAA